MTRINVAKYLQSKGFNQNEIANLLNVSQPVVSSYFKKELSNNNIPGEILLEAENVGNEIGKILEAEGKNGITSSIQIACNKCKILRQAGPTCILHKQVVPSLNDNCVSCHTEASILQLQIDKQGILNKLRNYYLLLSKQLHFQRIIPEIGMQVVMGIDQMQSSIDIAAFPNRIIKRKGTNPVADTPIFGGSETLSKILLLVRKYYHEINCIMAMKTSEWLENKLKSLNYQFLKTQGFDRNYTSILSELEFKEPNFFILIDQGSIGYEAITYLFLTFNIDLLEVIFPIIS